MSPTRLLFPSARKAVIPIAGSEWYVIQVARGREEAMAEVIDRVVPKSALEECFFPRFATEIKVRGRWLKVEKPLLPGYLIGVTSDPRALDRALLDLEGFARVLMQGEMYVPLARDEREIIGGFTRPGDRVVPMSRGFKDGDSVVITSGPLVGRQGMVKSVNRRKSLAFLELNICGRKVSTRVGLGIVSVPESIEGRRASLYVREAQKTA